MFPNHIDYKIDASKYFDLPRMFDARQRFVADRIVDIEGKVGEELAALDLPPLAGKSVALTGGSRGVCNQKRILAAAIAFLKGRGARPFIVPAMGSHGGATAEGQLALLADYDITPESMGVPIPSSLDVVLIGATNDGYPVYCDKHAHAADYILPIHRVKPHTGFKAAIESGVCKMMVIGLGNHKGATNIHNQGFSDFARIIPAAAEVFLSSGKILAGLAMIENAFDQTMHIEGIPAGRILDRERDLLVMAKKALPRLFADQADVLVVEQIGKNISGAGMDSNITGRALGPDHYGNCKIHRIVVLGISPESHGHATGMGLADISTLEAVRDMDFGKTYTNSITAGTVEGSHIPLLANTDEDAVRIGLCTTPKLDPARARVIQIRHTLSIERIRMSETYLDELWDEVEVLSDPYPMPFDAKGRLERIPVED